MQRFSDPAEPIRVRAGETFAIVLAGNPTTGYTWQAETDTPALELLGQQFEAGKGSVGAGGQEVLHFQAQQPGEVTITCAYGRPWGGEARDIRRFRVVIEA